ncbi:hypothetical protein [Streptomyces sp. AC495_CC817]|uniref:hypothetical protein n=1 Tax=Streptomyces sp. AC495_CC817 TaxID=2823900 RepID=UPI001C25DE69|nr:hypothetical protein [Streptomyces sp. AC495_CC817]
MRRRTGWWFVFGGAVLVAGMVWGFQALRGATLTRQDMAAHLEFPATYNGREEDFTGHSFTLRDDGTATFSGVVLGSGEEVEEGGRRCLIGDVRAVDGEGRWWADDSGWVIVEADGVRSRFHQDDPLFMAEGWGKVYLLTPCTQEYAATFVTPDVDYSG